jgi:hypothetical protein
MVRQVQAQEKKGKFVKQMGKLAASSIVLHSNFINPWKKSDLNRIQFLWEKFDALIANRLQTW